MREDYDQVETRVLSLFSTEATLPQFHGTVLIPANMEIETARKFVRKVIADFQDSKQKWTWSQVHTKLSEAGFHRISQTFVYDNDVRPNHAVMAAVDYDDEVKLYSIEADPVSAERTCDALKKQGWKIAYSQTTDLKVGHIATGSLHKSKTQIVADVIREHKAIGSWYTYEPNQVPGSIKVKVAGSVEEFDKIAIEVCADQYRTYTLNMRKH